MSTNRGAPSESISDKRMKNRHADTRNAIGNEDEGERLNDDRLCYLRYSIVWTGFSLIFVVVGLVTANKGRNMRSRGSIIDETETTDARYLRPGRAEAKGTARRTEGGSTTESPISRKETLATKVKVEEYQSNSKGGGSRNTVYERKDAVPFVVEDGTGEVRVDPTHPKAHISPGLRRERVGGGEEPPDDVRRFLEREEEVDAASNYSLGPLDFGQRRRYSEGAVEPGDDVYALGRACEEDAGWGKRGHVIDEPTESGEFVVSDKSEDQLVKEGKWQSLLPLVFGSIFALVGGLFSLVGLNMII